MQMIEADYRTLLTRMKKIERQTRIWKTGVLLGLLILGISVAANVRAQQNAEPIRATTVESQHFVLRDAAGSVMGQLTVKDGTAQLELFDSTGRLTWSTNQRGMPLK